MYHVNPQTGNPGKCRAKTSCPYGDLDTEHYATRDSARAAYENKQAGAFGDGVVQVTTPDGERFDLDTRKFINSDRSVKGRASNLDRAAILAELVNGPDVDGYEPNEVTLNRFKSWWAGGGVTREDYDAMWNLLNDVQEGAAFEATASVPGSRKLLVRAIRVQEELHNEWAEEWD